MKGSQPRFDFRPAQDLGRIVEPVPLIIGEVRLVASLLNRHAPQQGGTMLKDICESLDN